MVEVMARSGSATSANGRVSKGEEATLFAGTDAREARRAQSWLDANIKRAKKDGMFAVVGDLTPALAEILLDRNPDNRTGSFANLKELVKNICNGDYELNGEPIIVSSEGDLNDGQHRCWAVIEAGRGIRTLFTFGATRDSRTTVDQGRARTVGDYLTMDGMPYGTAAGVVARYIWLYDKHGRITNNPDHQPTKAQIRDICHALQDDILTSVRTVPIKGSKLAGGHTTLAFCHYLFAKRDRTTADHFIERLVRGDNLSASNPIYVCRERLHEDYRKQQHRLRTEEKIELIFHAWNAYRRDRRLRQIKVMGSLPALER